MSFTTKSMDFLTPINAAKAASVIALVHGAAHFVRPKIAHFKAWPTGWMSIDIVLR
jgi:hypothetical protein